MAIPNDDVLFCIGNTHETSPCNPLGLLAPLWIRCYVQNCKWCRNYADPKRKAFLYLLRCNELFLINFLYQKKCLSRKLPHHLFQTYRHNTFFIIKGRCKKRHLRFISNKKIWKNINEKIRNKEIDNWI